MATVKIVPNDPAPSDAEKTQYNVFVDGDFIGYIAESWMGYWNFYINGKCKEGWADRKELFEHLTTKLDI